MKHNAFEGEREWRLISPVTRYYGLDVKLREGKSTLIPYQEFSLTHDDGRLGFEKLLIGPTPSPDEAIRAIRSLLETHKVHKVDGNSVDVEHSEIPFRDW